MPQQSKGVALLVLTAILWSLGGLLIKWVDWNPLAIAGARSAIAAAVMLVVVRRRNFTWSLPQIGGAVAYAATVMLFVVANKWTTAANAILIQYTAPIYIAFLSPWFLRERVGLRDWLIVGSMVLGLTLFFLDELTVRGFWGNAAAVGSGIAFAWLVLFLRRQKAGSPLESIFLGNLIAAAVCVPWMLGSAPSGGGWGGLCLLGVVQLGLPYILYSAAIKRVTALEAMLIPAIEPVLNPALVFLVLGERPGPWALVGGAIVIASVAARAFFSARREARPGWKAAAGD